MVSSDQLSTAANATRKQPAKTSQCRPELLPLAQPCLNPRCFWTRPVAPVSEGLLRSKDRAHLKDSRPWPRGSTSVWRALGRLKRGDLGALKWHGLPVSSPLVLQVPCETVLGPNTFSKRIWNTGVASHNRNQGNVAKANLMFKRCLQVPSSVKAVPHNLRKKCSVTVICVVSNHPTSPIPTVNHLVIPTELSGHVCHQGHLFVQLRALCQIGIALGAADGCTSTAGRFKEWIVREGFQL